MNTPSMSKLVPNERAVWSKELMLTASCLSPLPMFEPWLEHVKKSPVT